MLRLVKIEWKKLIHQKSLWVSFVVCSLVIVFFGFFLDMDIDNLSNSEDSTTEEIQLQEQYEQSSDWKEKLRIQMQLNAGMEDFYGAEQVAVKNNLLQYRIDNDLEPYESNTAWNFVAYTYEILNFLIGVFAIVFAVDIIIKEFSNNTIKLIFTKPYSKTGIVMSKYIACAVEVIVLTVLTFLVSLVVGGIFFSFSGAGIKSAIQIFDTIYTCNLGTIAVIYCIAALIKSLVIMTVAFLTAIVTKNNIASMLIALGILMFGDAIANKIYDMGLQSVRFTLLGNMDLIHFIDSYVKDGYSLGLMGGVLVFHFIVFVILGKYVIQKRDY